MFAKIKQFYRALVAQPITVHELELGRPFTSKNTWRVVTDFYMSLPHPPRILEYGSGFSTFYHLKNLEEAGGELVSVEHDPIWYRMLKSTLHKRFPNTHFEYLLRKGTGKRTGCGTLEEFQDYVKAPKGKFDVIIVDGRARKACVQWVLGQDLLKEGGMLALFEAGRGNPRWPKKSQMERTYDYQPEVNELVGRGGVIVDGTGYANWPSWTSRRPIEGSLAQSVPMELCYWVKR